ncbi:hypothetical protein [Kocuria sp. KH4]
MSTTTLTPEETLRAAEDALERARRSYARKLLRLVAEELTRRHPEAARLDVFADTGAEELTYALDVLRDADDEPSWVDPGRVVVVRETADDALGGTVTVATRDVRELVVRAFEVYEGPVVKLLRHDTERDVYWLDLRRA